MNSHNWFLENLDKLRVNRAGDSLTTRLSPTPGKDANPPLRTKICGEFLKGPIPLAWLSAAAGIRGKSALAVGLALWFEAGRKRCHEVRLTSAILRRFGVCRKSKYAGLDSLEKAGLIAVNRQPRKNPVVTIQQRDDRQTPD